MLLIVTQNNIINIFYSNFNSKIYFKIKQNVKFEGYEKHEENIRILTFFVPCLHASHF